MNTFWSVLTTLMYIGGVVLIECVCRPNIGKHWPFIIHVFLTIGDLAFAIQVLRTAIKQFDDMLCEMRHSWLVRWIVKVYMKRRENGLVDTIQDVLAQETAEEELIIRSEQFEEIQQPSTDSGDS